MESMRFLLAPLLISFLAAAPGDPARQQFEAAVKALSSGDLAAAERGFQAVLQSNPKNIGALGNLGVVYSRLNRPADAIRTYRTALEILPNDPLLNLNLALAHLKVDDYRAAGPPLKKVLAVQPGNRQARELLATTQIFTGEVDTAVETLDSLRAEGNNGVLYFLSIGYLKQGRRDDARKTMEELFRSIKPAQAKFLAGRAYYESAVFEEAVKSLEEASRLEPDIPGVWRELGKAYVSLRKSDEARQALAKALQQSPGDDEASYFLGALDVLDGRFEEGIPRLEQTRAARPDFWGSYYYLGRAKLARKDPAAADLLQTAARLNPGEAPVFFQLARALDASGRKAEAAQARARFAELNARRRAMEQESLVAR